jgi:hypothetical protein
MKTILQAQGIYYVITGVWPWISMETFELVTGAKTDDWLVQTVGALAATIGASILLGTMRETPVRGTFILSVLSALSFLVEDVVFVASGIISRVYLADAGVQIFLLATTASLSVASRLAGTSKHRGSFRVVDGH